MIAKFLAFRGRMTTLTFIILLIFFAANSDFITTNKQQHANGIIKHAEAHLYHQINLGNLNNDHNDPALEASQREAIERGRRIRRAAAADASAKEGAVGSKSYSHSKSIQIGRGENSRGGSGGDDNDYDEEDEEAIKQRARERFMKERDAKRERMNRLNQPPTVGSVEAFDYHDEVHGEFEREQLAEGNPYTGFGESGHRRLIVNEGDTDEHRRSIEGIARVLDDRLEREGDPNPIPHEAHLPVNYYASVKNEEAIQRGPLGQKATRKIREHLVKKGLIEQNDYEAKLHIPHDLVLTEEDFYHDEDDGFYEEVEEEVPETAADENDVSSSQTGGAAEGEQKDNSKSRSLSPSLSRGKTRKIKKASTRSASASLLKSRDGGKSSSSSLFTLAYSNRRPLAGAKSRTKKHVTNSHLLDLHPVGVKNFDNIIEKNRKKMTVVADLNAHEKEKYENEFDANGKEIDDDSFIRYQTDDDFAAALTGGAATSASEVPINVLKKHRDAFYNTRRERMKALLRERRLFYPIQQPKETLSVVDPKDWESFVCQVCSAFATEYSDGLISSTVSIHPLRLIDNAETNVTDFYTWSGAGAHHDNNHHGGGGGLRLRQRGSLERTRPDDRWDHKPHTPAESAVRNTMINLFHHFLVTLYEKEVFLAAMQNIATATRPTKIPDMFIREELCAIRKEVCPVSKLLYGGNKANGGGEDGGRFGYLRNSLAEAINHYEAEHAKNYDYVKEIIEERELKKEIEIEDEEDRIALLEEEMARQNDEAENDKIAVGQGRYRGDDDEEDDNDEAAGGKKKRTMKPFSKSLGIGEVDANGNRVIIEGDSEHSKMLKTNKKDRLSALKGKILKGAAGGGGAHHSISGAVRMSHLKGNSMRGGSASIGTPRDVGSEELMRSLLEESLDVDGQRAKAEAEAVERMKREHYASSSMNQEL